MITLDTVFIILLIIIILIGARRWARLMGKSDGPQSWDAYVRSVIGEIANSIFLSSDLKKINI